MDPIGNTRGMGWSLAVFVLAASSAATAQVDQVADPDFDAKVAKPAYSDKHPRVLLDAAHHNFHTAAGRYKPFADLITSDGCKVTGGKEKFTAESLKGYDVLVISNARGGEGTTAQAMKPAFSEAECDAVRDWVRAGGALLLIADHFPMGPAAQNLSKRFEVEMSGGMTIDEPPFSREDKSLVDHAITRARSEAERVRRVKTFTGQSLAGPPDGVVLLRLPQAAKEHIPDEKDPIRTPPHERSSGGRAMGIALKFGKGRVVVLGEAAMLTAQVVEGERVGLNVPEFDNRQFALNVVHWLTGMIE